MKDENVSNHKHMLAHSLLHRGSCLVLPQWHGWAGGPTARRESQNSGHKHLASAEVCDKHCAC